MKLGLRDRLLAGFAVMFLLTALVGAVGFMQGRQAALQAATIHQHDMRGMKELSSALDDMLEMRQAVLLQLITDDAGTRAALDAEIPALHDSLEKHFAAMADTWTSGPMLQEFRALQRAWAPYPPIRDQTRTLARSGRVAEARRLAASSGRATFGRVQEQFVRLLTANEQVAENRYRAMNTSLARWRYLMLALTLVALAAAVILAVRLARRIGGGVAAIAASAARLAEGDLISRAEIHTGDELQSLASSFNQMADRIQLMIQAEREAKDVLETAVGEYSAFAAGLAGGDLTVRLTPDGSSELRTLSGNLNDMAGALAGLSTQVRGEVEHITASAAEILTSVNRHATSAREQSAAIAETSSTADEVRVSAEDTARRAEAVADQAQDAAEAGGEGRQAVDAIVVGMHDIRGTVDEIANGILTLSGQTQQVGEIIAMVNDLADQSNLLAVNAAIEAAKAGEQGRGFAVVADEVRTLADQSKRATVQVRDILDQVQRSADSAVRATEEGTKVVESGERLAERAGQIIATLSDMVQRAAQSSRQIAASAHQQSVGMDQIATAMHDLRQTTEQFQTAAREAQATAKSLNDVAARLDELTAQYRLAPQ